MRLNIQPSCEFGLCNLSLRHHIFDNFTYINIAFFHLHESIKQEQRNSDNEGIRYKLGNAKIKVEIELQQDEIIKLNLKKKIAELLDGGANK